MAKIKAFLKKWIVNNIGFKILAVVFAFVLWLVILNTTDQETTRTITSIPVTRSAILVLHCFFTCKSF